MTPDFPRTVRALLATLLVAVSASLAWAGGPSSEQDADDDAKAGPGAVRAEFWQVNRIGARDIGADDGVTMRFADGQISGRSGCNRFTGAASLTAETVASGGLELGPIAGTRMACPEPASSIEDAFLAALGQIDGYRITMTGGLVLTGDDSVLIEALPALSD